MNGTFSGRRFIRALLLWLVAIWIIAAIAPYSRRDWLLENLLVFVLAATLLLTARRFTFSNFSYGLLGLFLTLHLVGAHYTYSEVPPGFWLQDALDLSRNHYDRFVHFCFGLLVAPPIRELLVRAAGTRSGWSYPVATLSILGFSGFYEALEGIVAMIVSPELGAAYLGTQGDEWDAQKDTALAFAGAVVAMLVSWRLAKRPR